MMMNLFTSIGYTYLRREEKISRVKSEEKRAMKRMGERERKRRRRRRRR